MDNKLRTSGAIVAGAVAAMAMPCLAWALGLGQIQSNTRIGQNFQARIPILAASNADVQGLDVGLASPAAYKQAGVSEPDYLFGLKFSVQQGANGPYVLVTSDKPVRLPFLNLLVHASWSSGEVTRQYTVLLNPPVFAAGTSRQPVSAPSSPAQQNVVQQQPAQQPQPQQPAQQPQPQQPAQQPQPQQPAQPQAQPVQPTQQTAPATQPVHSYGPVQHGATLWGLARKLRPDNSVTVNQMMVALYKENPHAFYGNINRLKAGYVLKVPSRDQVENMSAAAATREVASQNRTWQASRGQSSGQPNRVAAAQATASQPETGRAGAGSQTASASAGSGRVLLTTPKVTATQGAVAPGTVASGKAVVQAAEAGSSAGAAQAAAAAGTSGSVAGTGASAGGPAKVRSNAMANLAAGAASTGTRTAAAKQSAAGAAKQSGAAANNVNNVNNANTVNTANTGAAAENGAGWESWVTEPRGWAIIGGVILLLAALILLLLQRRRATAAVLEEASRDGDPGVGEEFGAGMEGAAEEEAATDGGETEPAAEEDDDFGAETYIGGPAAALDEPDPVAEAEFHAGYGEYGEATRILREALGREPERTELKRKLLDVLFAAGDAEAFEAEAEADRDVFGQESDDWREIAAMGRQLRPESKLFDTDAGGSEPASGGAGSSESLDFDMDLDRLSGTEAAEGGQDEFERTMDELSTFIETYIPGSGDAPLNLQLPPEEAAGQQSEQRPPEDSADADEPIEFDLGDSEPAEALEPETPAEPRESDELEPIEFEPELQAESGITESTDAGYGEEVDEGGAEVGGENLIDTKLDLARAYLDMDDPESARGVLEEVLDEGDEKQRSEAQRLLETLA